MRWTVFGFVLILSVPGHICESSYEYDENGYTGYENGNTGYTNTYTGYENGYTGYTNTYTGYENGYTGYTNTYTGYENGYTGYENGYSGYTQTYTESPYDTWYPYENTGYTYSTDTTWTGTNTDWIHPTGSSSHHDYYTHEYSGSMEWKCLRGNLTLPLQSWEEALNDPSSTAFSNLKGSLSLKVNNTASTGIYYVNFVYFDVIRFLPGVIAEYELYLYTEPFSDIEETKNTTKYLFLSMSDVTNATVVDECSDMTDGHSSWTNTHTDWIHPTGSSSHHDYSTLESSGYMEWEWKCLRGNLTLSSQNWEEALNDPSSTAFGNLEGNLSSKVENTAHMSIYYINFVHFDVIRFLPGLIAEYELQLNLEPFSDIEDTKNTTKYLLLSMSDVTNATVVEECSGMPDGHSSWTNTHTDWIHPTGSSHYYDYSTYESSGYMEEKCLRGNLTLPYETWEDALYDPGSITFSDLEEDLTSKVENTAKMSIYYINFVHFDVIRFLPGLIAEYELYLNLEPFSDIEDTRNITKHVFLSMPDVTNATVVDECSSMTDGHSSWTNTHTGWYGSTSDSYFSYYDTTGYYGSSYDSISPTGTFSDDYSTYFSGDYSGDYSGDFSGNGTDYSGDFSGNGTDFSGDYSGNGTDFSGDFSGNGTDFSGDFSGNGTDFSGDFSGNGTDYSGDFSGNGTDFSGDFSGNGTDFSGDFSGNGTDYSGDFSGNGTDFSGDYSGNGTDYSGDFSGNGTDFSGDFSGNGTDFSGDFSGNGTDFSGDFSGNGTDYSGDFSGNGTDFSGDYSGNGTDYSGDFSGNGTDFSGDYSGNGTDYSGDFSGNGTDFSGDYSGSGTDFSGDYSGNGTDYSGDFSGNGTDFSGDFSGNGTDFSGDFSGNGTDYSGDFSGNGTDFSGDYSGNGTDFSGDYSGNGTDFSGNGTDFSGDFSGNGTDFSGDYSGNGTDYSGDFSGNGTDFSGDSSGNGTEYSGDSSGNGTDFSGDSSGNGTDFSGDSSGNGTDFSGDFSGNGTDFSGDYSGNGTDYSGDGTDYSGDDHGALNVTVTTGVEEVGNAPRLALRCGFQSQSDYEYEVKWLADGEPIYTSQRLSQEEADSHFVTNDDLTYSGYALEKVYRCVVRAFQIGAANSIMTGTSDDKYAVEFHANHVEINRGQEASFTMSINIPLPSLDGENSYIIIKVYDPYESHSCGDSTLAIKNTDTCGLRIYGTSNYSAGNVGDKTIRLTTKNNNNWDLKDTFWVKVKIEGVGVENFWSGTFTQEFEVTVNDDNYHWYGTYCYAVNDPRFKTFDWLFYSINSFAGILVMYKHETYPAEVQINTEACNWGWGTCVCAVVVRAGSDVFMMDHCNGNHTTTYARSSGNGLLYVTQPHLNDYEIFFPHGTSVYVQVSPPYWPFTLVNVFIFPSPADVGNIKGLCGTLNGDIHDDFTHEDGSVSATDVYWWGWQIGEPTDFADSWLLTDEESLFDDGVLDSLEEWSEEETYCVCTGSGGEDAPTCSMHEKRTCADQEAEITRRSVDGRKKRMAKLREVEGYRMEHEELSRRLNTRKEMRLMTAETRRKRSTDTSVTATREEAEAWCNASLTRDCGGDGSQQLVNMNDIINLCVEDKQLNKTVSWETTSCSVTITIVNTTMNKNASDAAAANETFCPGNCYGQGNCSEGADGQGECHCNDGYEGEDCGTPANALANVFGSTSCNTSCPSVTVMVSVITSNAVCKIRLSKILLPNNTVEDVSEITVPMNRLNSYEGICNTQSTSRRRRRSTGSGSSDAADIYTISVSNDGTTFGDSIEVAALDNTCLTYNASTGVVTLDNNYCLIEGTCYENGVNQTGQTCSYCDIAVNIYDWTLSSGYCLIDGACYTNGTTKAGDSCKYCHVTADTDDWTDDNETASCLPTESSSDSGMEGYLIAVIVLSVLIVLGGVAAGGYFLWRKHKLSKKSNAGLFDTVAHGRFLLRVEASKRQMLIAEGIHPPPLHPAPARPTTLYPGTSRFAEPNPGSEPIPDNLYTEREVTNKHTTWTPAMPKSLYKGFSEPNPASEKIPSNLYTEREATDKHRTPSPSMPTSEIDRAHTPNMPNIEA
ncbi:uncharacterized protein LOC123553955 isoform X2 [Mercenaria mercenaria]|uniref:uncharacterized protein LOC123553955 isoform X2 n=1 Tax=Mercenaria mercenaria TaxID=6596 RepID=UPI00234E9420|nr:uncharacterized protein LOC123553955 isoform X2 [Mercenaria mercenaria]